MDYKTVTNCRVCKSTNLTKYIDLGSQPLPNNLLEIPSESKTYPLAVLFCNECFLSQLSVVVDPKIMFSEYSYHSSVSKTFQEHCYELALDCKKFKFEHPLVIDIASNDGCLLEQFKKAGYQRLLGVEPAKNLVKNYNERGLLYLNKFWNKDVLDYGPDSYETERASIITATNVFAHVDDLDDFLEGVRRYLTPSGIFIAEFPYLPNLISNMEFDTIYHEHLSYFLLKPLIRLFLANGLKIFDVKRLSIHGGSIRIYACKDDREVKSSVHEMVYYESDQGLYSIEPYKIFAENIKKIKKDLLDTLFYLAKNEKSVVGYGASAKGCSLLNYCGINKYLIQYIVDDTPYKQGKYLPGSNIPIESKFVNPDYIVLLAWNFEKEMRKKTSWHKGKYIIPIPEVRVI